MFESVEKEFVKLFTYHSFHSIDYFLQETKHILKSFHAWMIGMNERLKMEIPHWLFNPIDQAMKQINFVSPVNSFILSNRMQKKQNLRAGTDRIISARYYGILEKSHYFHRLNILSGRLGHKQPFEEAQIEAHCCWRSAASPFFRTCSNDCPRAFGGIFHRIFISSTIAKCRLRLAASGDGLRAACTACT